jgi:predicted ATPase
MVWATMNDVDDTQWYVITGGPFAGKTTLIKHLQGLGHNVEEESARAYIDERLQQGETIESIRKDEAAFQQAVLDRKIERHERLSPNQLVFFDRGMPDTIAYYRANDLPISLLALEMMKKYRYRKVFLLALVGHSIDHARTESPEKALRIHTELKRAYEELGMPVIEVPVMPLLERSAFILSNL